MYFFLLFIHFVLVNISPVIMLHYKTKVTQVASLSTKYDPQVKLKMCLLTPDAGPCRGNILMYYFDPEYLTCEPFGWGGCQGNGNRFDSQWECEDTCLTQPNEPTKRPRYCELTFDYGYCFGAIKRYYYDRLWQVCKERIYSGCGGNKNNFYNKEQCDEICRFGNKPLPPKSKSFDSGGHTVLYVYTNGTKRTRPSTKPSVYTSPKPREYYNTNKTAWDKWRSTTRCWSDKWHTSRTGMLELLSGGYRKNAIEKK